MSDIIKAHSSVHKTKFTIVANNILQTSALSYGAAFLISYLTSFPEGWKFHNSMILERMDIGLNKLKDLFKELRVAGYMRTIAIQNKDGVFVGKQREFAASPIFLHENPCKNELPTEGLEIKPSVVSCEPKVYFPDRPEIKPCISNTDLVTNTNTNTDPINTNNNNSNTRVDVVVSKMNDYEKKLIYELEKLGCKRELALDLIQSDSRHKLEEKIILMRQQSKPIVDAYWWLKSALERDYPPKPITENKPRPDFQVNGTRQPDSPTTLAHKAMLMKMAGLAK